MTFHFDDFNYPAALDDANEQTPETQPALVRKIEAVCSDPDCPNNPQAFRPPPAPGRVQSTADAIYQVDPKSRCIL